jgi:cyclic pyranopterin phosphate synthase
MPTVRTLTADPIAVPPEGPTLGRSDGPSPPPAMPGEAPLDAPLIDRQHRAVTYLRVSVTDRCNYRCTYCMPEDGVSHVDRSDILSFEEIAALVRCFVRLGVDRVRLTGGEPTVRRDLVDLVRLLRGIPGLREIALSTNGHLLPELAVPLRAAGIDRLNISIDTLDPERFAKITRRGDLGRVLAGVEAARAAGFSSIKINTVAVKGFNDAEVGALCEYAFSRGLVPRFIEQMPMAGGALYVPGTLLSAAETRRLIEAAYPGSRLVADREGRAKGGGPARYWALEGGEGYPAGGPARLVGLITPMTEHFCDTCNRVRLSAAGALHACLAYDDAVDLRGVLARGGPEAVMAEVRQALSYKRDGHDFQLVGLGGPRKAMVQIGG